MAESVEAVQVMLGDQPALVALPLPDFIDEEDVEIQNGIVILKEIDERTSIEAYYTFSPMALRYYKMGINE